MFSSIIFLAALSTIAGASLKGPAEFVPQIFERTFRPAGGWALALNSQETCPADAPICGSSWCCPSSLTCVTTGNADTAEACCPGEINCISAFQATPACADDSWSLWNATLDTNNVAEYFCCLPGQSGLQDGTCVASDQVSAATQVAVELNAGSSGTIPPSSASTPSTSSVVSATTTKSASTTKSSAVSSLAGSSTGSSAGSSATKASATPTSAASSTPSTTAKSGGGDRNVIGAGFLGLIGAVGFAFGIL